MDIKQFKKMIQDQEKATGVPEEAIPFVSLSSEESEMDEELGKSVTVVGIARNALLGAVLVREGEEPTYIEGLEEWESKILGKKVEATGILVRKKIAPDPVVNKNGGISHGMPGKARVLEGAVWKVV